MSSSWQNYNSTTTTSKLFPKPLKINSNSTSNNSIEEDLPSPNKKRRVINNKLNSNDNSR